MKFLNNLLNKISLFSLVIYGLLVILGYAVILGFMEKLPYSGVEILLSSIILGIVCSAANWVITKAFSLRNKIEPTLITALILALILTPSLTFSGILINIGTGIFAIVSKYVLVLGKKHLFNPAAIAPFLLSIFGVWVTDWWVGSLVMLPVVAIVGWLFVHKLGRYQMFFAFFTVSFAILLISGVAAGTSTTRMVSQIFTSWPIIFFGTVMLTEPMTSPVTTKSQIIYGAIVGIMFSIGFKMGTIFATPESSLVVGNVFTYFVSFRNKWLVQFRKNIGLTP